MPCPKPAPRPLGQLGCSIWISPTMFLQAGGSSDAGTSVLPGFHQLLPGCFLSYCPSTCSSMWLLHCSPAGLSELSNELLHKAKSHPESTERMGMQEETKGEGSWSQ